MCIYAQPVMEVKGTQLLVLPFLDGKRQLTVYQNSVEVSAENEKNAMILPVPFPDNHEDPFACIMLLDLSPLNHLFDHMNLLRPATDLYRVTRSLGVGKRTLGPEAPLEVHSMGSYHVSVAPSLSSLSRVNANVFTLAPGVQSALSQRYSTGFAFVVCRLKSRKLVDANPIAFISPCLTPAKANANGTSERGSLHVPTTHAHDGHPDSHADWDHAIWSSHTDVFSPHDHPGKSLGEMYDEAQDKEVGVDPTACLPMLRHLLQGVASRFAVAALGAPPPPSDVDALTLPKLDPETLRLRKIGRDAHLANRDLILDFDSDKMERVGQKETPWWSQRTCQWSVFLPSFLSGFVQMFFAVFATLALKHQASRFAVQYHKKHYKFLNARMRIFGGRGYNRSFEEERRPSAKVKAIRWCWIEGGGLLSLSGHSISLAGVLLVCAAATVLLPRLFSHSMVA